MARRSSFFYIVLILFVALMGATLFGCVNTVATDENQITVTNIVVLTKHDGHYFLNANGHIDDMDLSEITIKVTYSNGDEEIIAVDDTMFSLEDINKFETKGDHTIFINYKTASAPLTISVRSMAEENVYRAIFMPQGGTTVKTIYTKVITSFPDSYRDNFTFDGWYTDQQYLGERVVAPYTLNADTYFYAKWIDNRRCTVTFYDLSEIYYQFEVVYGSSINLEDMESYPAPPAKLGKQFVRWEREEGDESMITSDLVVRAKYDTLQCKVEVQGDAPVMVYYGNTFRFDRVPPAENGYQTRWVVYIDGSSEMVELSDPRLNYNEETKTFTVENDLRIEVYRQINVYEIRVYNGLPTQSESNLKAGNIIIDQVYDSNGGIFRREYNSNFNLAITDGRNDVIATQYEGYSVEWCFITYDETNKEIWRNANNLVWNDEAGKFIEEIGNSSSRNYELKDAAGNVLARIQNGNITQIQGSITIKPKYTKKIYKVTLTRNNQELPLSFNVPYYTDFALYDPSLKEYEGRYSDWTEVKDSYLKNTVADWLTNEMAGEETWQTAKWDIAWYNNPSSTANEYKVNFEYNDQAEAYGYYTIRENTVLYARDIDNRTYDIIIRYGYNFANGMYTKEVKYTDYKQQQALELPTDLTDSITYDGVTYSYLGLYDFPYSGPNTKNYGSQVINQDARTKNEIYYAHYGNSRKYEVRIVDKAQSESYPADSPFAVLDGSIYYEVYSGTTFNSSMLYKGTPNTPGQVYYNNKTFYENFNAVTTPRYQSLITFYGGNKTEALAEINRLIDEKEAIIRAYTELLGYLNTYNYGQINLDGYSSYVEYYNKFFASGTGNYDLKTTYGEYVGTSYRYISNAYNALREEIFDLKEMRTLISNYDADLLRASTYENNWDYYPYSDSVNHLNGINPGVTDYYFAGWYYDPQYTQKADDISTDPENPMLFSMRVFRDITLYAKWVDKKKGSEGLIFEKVGDKMVIVVDYLNAAQSEGKYTGENYSRNLNDQDKMPIDLGTKISVQIPSEHKLEGTGEVCTVVGIVAGAFDINASIITDISLPNTIKFVEEGVFRYTGLRVISYQTGDTNYLYSDADIALYQNLDYTQLNNVGLSDGRTLGSYRAGTLIAYASKSIVNTVYNIPDAIDGRPIFRIGDHAFRSTGALVTVNIGKNVEEIGDYAFMGCNKLAEVYLPNSLTIIGVNAFKDCGFLKDIHFVPSPEHPVSVLSVIKKGAFENTAWLINSNGLVMIDTILIGVQVRGDGQGYEKDGGGNVIVNENNEKMIIGRENGDVIYTIYINAATDAVSRIVINKAITVICDHAFSGITGLVSLDINAENLVLVDDYAFNNCSGLNVIYWRGASSEITIGENILAGCSRNISFVFPKYYFTADNMLTGARWAELVANIDMMEIEEGAYSTLYYYRKAQGTTVTIPSFVTAVADNVFSSGFGNIAQLIIPNSVVRIGSYAFANMTDITSVYIPASVTEIGLGAFYNCTRLIQLSAPFIGGSATINGYLGYIFGDGSVTALNQVNYVTASLETFTLVANPAYTDIAAYAMYGLKIINLTLADNIITIGNHAFEGNDRLRGIAFTSYIQTVGDYAFYGNTSLTSITFPTYSNISTFGDYSFYGCTSLAALSLNLNARTIGAYAFAGCTLLRNVTINRNLETIGNNAFDGCSTLQNVVFPAESALTSIGNYAFRNCAILTNIAISDSVTSIGLGAFEGCNNLSSITLGFVGENLLGTDATHFGYIFGAAAYNDNAAKVPAALKTVTIRANKNGTTITIADYAFYNLTNLTTINLSGADIASIGANAFAGCPAQVIQ